MLKAKRQLVLFIALPAILIFSGCNTIGFLLFYRDGRTKTVYTSPGSKKNYYTVKATTLSHCGCTHLYADSYKNRNKEFYITYTNEQVKKILFRYNSQTFQTDTIRLLATTSAYYTTPFDSLDKEIFSRIDSIIVQKPKGMIYPLKSTAYKGFIKDPYSANRDF